MFSTVHQFKLNCSALISSSDIKDNEIEEFICEADEEIIADLASLYSRELLLKHASKIYMLNRLSQYKSSYLALSRYYGGVRASNAEDIVFFKKNYENLLNAIYRGKVLQTIKGDIIRADRKIVANNKQAS